MKKNKMIFVLFAIYVILSAGGLILFKLGTKDLNVAVTSKYFEIKFSWLMILGIACYACSFLLWLFIVSKLNLSFAMPLSVGLVNTLVLIGSYFFLHETITITQWIGVVVIIFGLFLIA